MLRPTLFRRFSLFGCKQQQPLGELTVNMAVTAESSWSCCTSFTDGSSMWAEPPPVQQVEESSPVSLRSTFIDRTPQRDRHGCFHHPGLSQTPTCLQLYSLQQEILVHSSLSAPLSSPQTSSDTDFLLSSSFTMSFSTLKTWLTVLDAAPSAATVVRPRWSARVPSTSKKTAIQLHK